MKGQNENYQCPFKLSQLNIVRDYDPQIVG